MTLARRALISLAWVLASLIIAGAYQIYGLERLADEQVAERRIEAGAAHAGAMDDALLESILLLEQYVDSTDPAKVRELDAVHKVGLENERALRATTHLPKVVELLDEYDLLQPERNTLEQHIIAEAAQDGSRILELRKKRDELDRRARGYLKEIVSIENREMAATKTRTDELGRDFRRNTVILFAAVLAVAALILFSAARDISQRIVPLLGMSRKVTDGDFSSRVPVDGDDEVAMLSGAMNDMAAQLNELDHAKDEFVALASHQLRTPATAVKANVAMLLDGYFGDVTEEQREYLRDAYDANERQLGVIEDMLNVARAETGRLVKETSQVDLVALVAESIAEHRFGISGRNQELVVSLPGHPIVLNLDAKKLRMVADNLVSNASKYTPEGGRIEVRLEERGDQAVLSVSDNGVGIAAEDRDRLFRKFSRVDNPLSVAAGGTGLGLYLAREIVRLHGGEIRVDSEPGKGSTFRVILPRS